MRIRLAEIVNKFYQELAVGEAKSNSVNGEGTFSDRMHTYAADKTKHAPKRRFLFRPRDTDWQAVVNRYSR